MAIAMQSQNKIECVFELPSSNEVGRLIGSGGKTIKSICTTSGTSISFSRPDQLGTIFGSIENVAKAIELITIELGKVEDSITIAILVPSNQVGKLIGKKGATIKNLEQESGGKISISQPTFHLQKVLITGSPAAVTTVANYIVSCVTFPPSSRNVIKRPFSQAVGDYDRPTKTTRRIDTIGCLLSLLEPENVSKIIGSAGATIKRICKASTTRISFSGVVGVIKGNKKNVLQAIQEIVVELGMSNSQSISIAILAPRREVPKIIGKKGATIKNFEEQSGASISIGEGKVQAVKITGTTEQVCAAAESVFGCIDCYDDSELFPASQRIHTQQSASQEADIKLKVILSEESVSSIIGRGGTGIKQIARSTGVSVSFSRELCYEEGTETGTIVGKVSSVIRAFELFTQKIEKGEPVNIVVATNIIGWLVGKGGTRIKDTQLLSGTRISISKESVKITGVEEKIVSITGHLSAITVAIATLVNQMSQLQKLS